MRLSKALKLAEREGATIRSRSLNVYRQDLVSLIYWLFKDPSKGEAAKIKLFQDIMSTTDWELDV